MESASASEMSKIAEAFDDFRTKVLQTLGFRGVRVRIHCACAAKRAVTAPPQQIPGKSAARAVPPCGHTVWTLLTS